MSKKRTDIMPVLRLHPPSGMDAENNPHIRELVKFLARRAAERDYNELLKQENFSQMRGNPDD
ncbi:MAG: hypothetical protein CO093_08530 [Alphaproteobacteria bacterium CG_4_9_14_3_um_filter_47_13]|nr:MAG: hypothetical protein CO093_08530 [Alphaproteobacteria bacterium CG_4_9_14_3_um_filter_47_13]